VKRFAVILFALWACFGAQAETIPPAPSLYFNDYAGVVSPSTASTLNTTLENFERDTSSQVVVAIFNKMDSDSSIEDYTVRVKEAWKVGQKAKDNGAVLFVFIQNRTMYIQVGYGLEGSLPDALCKDIIEDEIKPHFKQSDFDGGLTAGVTAIIAATKGEYKGSGRTVGDQSAHVNDFNSQLIWALIVLAFIGFSLFRGVRSGGYSGWIIGGGGSSGWGGGGGFSGGGGGGGFSGGGGSGGGGGAGGSW
jgi:uncharacterized protein